jgi:hypothetical protein
MTTLDNSQSNSGIKESNDQSSQTNNPGLPLPPDNFANEDIFFRGDTDPPIILLSNEEHDSRFYNRLGFYCALDTVNDPNQKFNDLINEQISIIKEQRNLLLEYFKEKISRYDSRISEAEKKIESEKEIIKEYIDKKLPESKTEAENLCRAKIDAEHFFSKKVVEFGKRKSELIETAIETTRSNLNAIIENFQKSYEKRFNLNDFAAKDNKKASFIRVRQYEQLLDLTEKQLLRLVQKMEKLKFDGLNPALGHWLFIVGVTISILCGAYFFSIFALSKGISDSNIPFFLLQGAADFVHHFAPNSPYSIRLLALSGLIFLFILLVALFSWIAWKVLNSLIQVERWPTRKIKENSQNDAAIQFEMTSEREISFEFRSKGENFLHFWLQVSPILLVFGFVFALVFLTLEKNPTGSFTELADLDISLTGATIGALITLMFGGLFSIYILKIVEPRLERNESTPQMPIKQNIELILAFFFFTTSLLSLFFLESRGTGSAQNQHSGIIFIYSALVLTNGYLLGYALRIRAIFGARNYLERRMIVLARAIQNSSLPIEYSFTKKEDTIFKKEYSKIQRELFNLLLLKAKLGNQALGAENKNSLLHKRENAINEKKGSVLKNSTPRKRSIFAWINGVFSFLRTEEENKTIPESQKTENESPLTIEDWEIRLFPDITTEIEQLEKELNLARLRCRGSLDFVRQLEENKTTFFQESTERIRRLEDSINNLKKNREKTIHEKRKELRALARQSDSIQADILQGFNLGCWFISTVGKAPLPSID